MATLSFRAGQTFLLGGADYKLLRLKDEVWQIENLATGDYDKRPFKELQELYRTNELTLTIEHSEGCGIAEKIGRVILPDRPKYSDKQIARAQRYEAYLKELDKQPFYLTRRRDLQRFIDEFARILNDKEPPSPKTLLRARAKWIASGRDFRSLVPRFEECGTYSRLTPAMEWLIQRSFKCTFLRERPMKIADAWKSLDQSVEAINSGDETLIERRFTEEERKDVAFAQLQFQAPLNAPSKFSLYRRVKAMPLYDILVAQNGKQYADTVFRTSFPGAKVPRPLARVDGDETVTDIFVVDEIHHLWLGRACATVLYEGYCHGISGLYLGFEPHSVLAYFRAIRHSILPKTYISTEYPVIENSWEIYGQAELYNLDNAMSAHSKDFEEIAKDLNTIILFDPKQSPWFKGLVERFFRELNQEFLHKLPGTTFSHLAEIDGDYDPQKSAVIPYGLLMLMFHKFIVDIHLQSPNSGISDTPALRWSKFVHELPPPLPPSASELDIILGRRLSKPIWHYGIEIDSLYYQSYDLGNLRKRLSRQNNENPLVDVSAPPDDMGYIHVFDPEQQEYIRVPAVEQAYAKGLSRHAHKVHLQYARKYLNGATDVHALTRAQVDIWEMALEATKLNGSFARYMENHARDNPAGALFSVELVSRMVDKLAGKDTDHAAPSLSPPAPKVRKPQKDTSIDDLPCYESSSSLPDLSSRRMTQ